MLVMDLEKALLDLGCNPARYSILKSAHDCLCINRKDGKWVVYRSERGQDDDPDFESESEADACQFFFDEVSAMEHLHIVGFHKRSADADAQLAKLTDAGIECASNHMPAYRTREDPRYMVYVVGPAIFRFRELFGEPRVTYE